MRLLKRIHTSFITCSFLYTYCIKSLLLPDFDLMAAKITSSGVTLACIALGVFILCFININ